ncbi:glycosyltransferase [Silicimonas algicola]|uniref:Glycosyltransferase involved in cell wall biosynthesis n=2 Tax=Silicimonas algicola TaxID=1826607 RepID=A0A316G003_9RHOB|nr:glycosyltransferase [Silicimonas algicola]PWK53130.1 glycosyltransferase involved in cell wall biosynthesis [Silicimonas algicola]
MRCPTLAELPPPPEGRTGWPWTTESPQLPDTMPDGGAWPRISIVTPSYNQGQFIEETIRSVLLQGYPNLEYIIIDGGSTDGAVDIIKKYKLWLTYWVSERDRGQSHAINKGFEWASGALYNWQNSDDILFVSALSSAAAIFVKHNAQLICGRRIIRTMTGSAQHVDPALNRDWWNYKLRRGIIATDASFFSAALHSQIGALDERMHYQFDVDYFTRALNCVERITITEQIFSLLMSHADQKTRQTQRSDEYEITKLRTPPASDNLLLRLLQRVARTRFHNFVLVVALPFLAKAKPKITYISFDWLTGRDIVTEI